MLKYGVLTLPTATALREDSPRQLQMGQPAKGKDREMNMVGTNPTEEMFLLPRLQYFSISTKGQKRL
jgi:hypothetical protein